MSGSAMKVVLAALVAAAALAAVQANVAPPCVNGDVQPSGECRCWGATETVSSNTFYGAACENVCR